MSKPILTSMITSLWTAPVIRRTVTLTTQRSIRGSHISTAAYPSDLTDWRNVDWIAYPAEGYIGVRWGEAHRPNYATYRIDRPGTCPACGAPDAPMVTIDSVPGYGAGPTFHECEDCGERFGGDYGTRRAYFRARNP